MFLTMINPFAAGAAPIEPRKAMAMMKKDLAVLVDVREALPGHRIAVHVLDEGSVDAHLEAFETSPHLEACRERLAARGIDRVQFLYLHTAPSAAPGVERTHPEGEIKACHALSDPWIAPGS